MANLQYLFATALIVHYLIESLRALLPLLVFGLRDRFGWAALGPIGSIRLLGIALLLFALAFAAGALGRRLGRQTMVRGGVAGLVLFRLAAQLWSGDPLGNLLAVMLTILCFLLVWPAWMHPEPAAPSNAGTASAPGPHDVASGVLLGGVVSAALHGVMLSYDAIWRHDVPHLAWTVLLAVVLLIFAWRQAGGSASGRIPDAAADAAADAAKNSVTNRAIGDAASSFALGPFLFLQLLIFLNLARMTVLSGWDQVPSAAFQVLCQALGWILGWRLGTVASLRHRWSLWLLLSAVLIFSLAMAPWPTAALAAGQLLVGQLAASGLLTLALTRRRTAQVADDGPWRPQSVGSHGGGMLCLLGLLFLYYAGYDLPLPFDQILLLPFAALLLAMAARPRSPSTATVAASPLRPLPRAVLAVLVALIALPWLGSGGGTTAATTSPEPTSDLRVMTYNLHCGFGARGYLRLEEQAAVIASQRPDVVALQEVSRGWIINGGVDVLAWLAHRLDMDYRFAPTADPLWGNATLSRRPIVASHHLDYPSGAKQQIRRGLVEISVAADGDAAPWNLINTHFHHRRSDSEVRVEQAAVLLATWGGRPRTLLVGDLNATPESPEMDVLRDAGLADSIGDRLAAGSSNLGDGYTFRADALDRRIDYIWRSPDLHSRDLAIVPSTASDHLAIAATVTAADEVTVAAEVTVPTSPPGDPSATAPPPVP